MAAAVAERWRASGREGESVELREPTWDESLEGGREDGMAAAADGDVASYACSQLDRAIWMTVTTATSPESVKPNDVWRHA